MRPAADACAATARMPASVAPATATPSPSAAPPSSASRRASRTSRRSAARTRATRRLLAAVGGDLGRGAQQLDELRREVAPRGGLPRARRRERTGRSRGSRGRRAETRAQDDGRAGRNAAAAPTTPPRPASGQRRPEGPHVQVLQGVDVGDHAGEQIAAAVTLELRGRQRLDPCVQRSRARVREREAPHRAWRAVRRTAPAGASDQEAHADDRDGEREDRGLLAPPGRSDSPAEQSSVI